MNLSVIKLYLYFRYVIPNLVSGAALLFSNFYGGEFTNVPIKLDAGFIVSYTLLVVTIEVFFSFLVTKYKFVTIENRPQFVRVDYSSLNRLIFLMLIANIFFYLTTGIGKAGTATTSSISFIFNFFSLESFYVIYYFICRFCNQKLFFVNLVVFTGLAIAKGWTGYLFSVVILEIFIAFDGKKVRPYFYILLPVAYFAAAFVYQYLYGFKFLIRFSGFETITYGEALVKLTERFSIISPGLVGIQNAEPIKHLYSVGGTWFSEIISFFRPSIPSFLFSEKDFRSINNLLVQSAFPNVSNTTSSNMGILSYSFNLMNVDMVQFFVYLGLTALVLIVFRWLLVAFSDKKNSQLGQFIFFVTILGFIDNGALETSFFGFINIFYILIFSYLLRIFRFFRTASLETNAK